MGIVIPTGYAAVAATFEVAGDAEQMVCTFGVDSGAEEDPTVLADAIFDLWANTVTHFSASSIALGYRLGPFECTIMTATGPQTGTGADFRLGTNDLMDVLPNNCAVLAQKRTGRGGRKGRGRFFIPPCTLEDGDVDATGTIDTVHLASLQTWATAFLLALDSATTPMVLLHSEEAGPIAPDVVTNLVVQSRIATQRTRLRR